MNTGAYTSARMQSRKLAPRSWVSLKETPWNSHSAKSVPRKLQAVGGRPAVPDAVVPLPRWKSGDASSRSSSSRTGLSRGAVTFSALVAVPRRH